MDEIRNVVIATEDVEKSLWIVAKEVSGGHVDLLEIHFMEKYAPTVEYILRILRKGFGWMEVDRGEKQVKNTRCAFNSKGFCTNPELTGGGSKVRCTESVRINCDHYKKKFDDTIMVNFVLIEKAGGIRNM